MKKWTWVIGFCALLLIGSDLRALSLTNWEVDGTLSTARSHHGFAAISGDILVFGGYSASTALYHPGGTYDMLAPMPQERHNMAVAVHNGETYSIAGYHEGAGLWGRTTDVWSNDGSTDPWTVRDSLSYERANAGAAALGDYVYVVGGHHEAPTSSLSLVERYDPTAGGGWEQVASLNQDRRGLGVAAVNGKIYAIGGFTTHGNVTGGWLEVYDPGTNSWTYGPSMPTPRSSAATAVVGSRIYVIGGYADEVSGACSDVVEYFDVSDQTWHSDRSFPVGLIGPRAAAIGDTLYVSGGLTSSLVRLDTVYCATVIPEPLTILGVSMGALGLVGYIRKRK